MSPSREGASIKASATPNQQTKSAAVARRGKAVHKTGKLTQASRYAWHQWKRHRHHARISRANYARERLLLLAPVRESSTTQEIILFNSSDTVEASESIKHNYPQKQAEEEGISK